MMNDEGFRFHTLITVSRLPLPSLPSPPLASPRLFQKKKKKKKNFFLGIVMLDIDLAPMPCHAMPCAIEGVNAQRTTLI